jgi:hypothetical protein
VTKSGHAFHIFNEDMTGLDFYVDPSIINANRTEHIRRPL